MPGVIAVEVILDVLSVFALGVLMPLSRGRRASIEAC